MKSFALFLVLVALCFLLAHVMINDHGYILIAYDQMTFESSLWGLMLLVIISIGVLWVAVIGLREFLLNIFSVVYPVSSHARKVKFRRLFDRGLAEFAKGNWSRAEKLLGQAATTGEASLINYLAAAKASHDGGQL